jgi:hypothetical protein
VSDRILLDNCVRATHMYTHDFCATRDTGSINAHLQQTHTCNTRTPATNAHLQHAHTCNKRAPATRAHLQQTHTCNTRTPATNAHLQHAHTCNTHTRAHTRTHTHLRVRGVGARSMHPAPQVSISSQQCGQVQQRVHVHDNVSRPIHAHTTGTWMAVWQLWPQRV